MKQRNKISKTEANYRPGDAPEHCSICLMFRGSPKGNTCTDVAGPIESDAVCDLFEKTKRDLGPNYELGYRAGQEAKRLCQETGTCPVANRQRILAELQRQFNESRG